MRILVVDDNPLHQESANDTICGHELTVVGSYDETLKLLQKECKYDVVLSDLHMPMSKRTLASEAYNPRELVPYGFIIALRAASVGVKYIAVVTDVNHHQGAMSAAIDEIGKGYWDDRLRPNFVINGANAFFVHAPFKGEAKDWGKVLENLIAQ